MVLNFAVNGPEILTSFHASCYGVLCLYCVFIVTHFVDFEGTRTGVIQCVLLGCDMLRCLCLHNFKLVYKLSKPWSHIMFFCF